MAIPNTGQTDTTVHTLTIFNGQYKAQSGEPTTQQQTLSAK